MFFRDGCDAASAILGNSSASCPSMLTSSCSSAMYMSLKLVICILWLPFHSPATRMEKARFHELGPRAGFSSAPEFHRNERWPCVFCLVFPSCFCPSYWPTGGEMRRVSGLAALGALALSLCCWIFPRRFVLEQHT